MDKVDDSTKDELYPRIRLLILFRVIFAAFLLGSTLILHFREKALPISGSLLSLYLLTVSIFILSLFYAVLLRKVRRLNLFAYIQIGIDTLTVTLIIYLTGAFFSLFSFLYLVVIIYSSMLLYRKGGMVMAALSGIQYGILVDLQYFEISRLFPLDEANSLSHVEWEYVLFKICITMVACFAVAFLSGLLSEQTRKTRRELKTLEDHLKRVEKMALMGEMAAGLAHEIKNPLASLAGSIQLLREEVQYNPEHDQLMKIVLRETDRLSSLVNNFLLFAKPPDGKADMLKLDSALEEIISLFEKSNTISGKITISKSITPNLWIKMDPVHLRQIIWNLMLNAAEAIEAVGEIKVNMNAEKPNRVVITIEDDGVGIPSEHIKSIFNPFFTTKASGTGLGLSIVHRILETYGGRLEFDSQQGKGTLFKVTLNRAQAAV